MGKHESDGQLSPSQCRSALTKPCQAMSMVAGGAHGTASVIKTSVLRKDRLNEASYQARLDICKNCPGGHATFKENGSLHTCGPMLESLKGEGQGTCGCVLNKKARDAKESCPFGYWPTVQGEDLSMASPARSDRLVTVPVSLPCKKMKAPDSVIQHGFDRSRRQFIGKSVAALAGLAFTRSAFASIDDDTYYLPVSPCDSGSGTHVACSDIPSSRAGDVFKASQDDKCYTVQGTAPVKGSELTNASAVTPVTGTWSEDCCDCDSSTPGCTPADGCYAISGSGPTAKAECCADSGGCCNYENGAISETLTGGPSTWSASNCGPTSTSDWSLARSGSYPNYSWTLRNDCQVGCHVDAYQGTASWDGEGSKVFSMGSYPSITVTKVACS